ncbi:hypothetical protein [Pedobacter sp. GR22-6]|uniref:hypothetical protein n=1 Tax=Pedobacter sp. GR22-6 TaxID=3127957 RepID=UPI00307CEC0A
MKKKLTILCVSMLMLVVTRMNAQEVATTSTKAPVDSAARSKVILSAHVSTQGVGLDIKYAPTPVFGVRVGASVLPISGQSVYSIRQEPTDVDFDVDFANAHLLFDWHPFLKEKGLSPKVVVTAGAGYFWKREGNVVVSYRGTYKYGDILIPSEDLGQLTGNVEWHKVAPYLGFGFENVFPRNKFNLGFAVGTYYMGAPDATLVGTKFLSANTSNEAQLKKNMSYYRFLPVLQVNFNFGL